MHTGKEISMPACYSVLITGTNRGIGLQMVKGFALLSQGPEVIIAATRNPGNAKELQAVAAKFPKVHIIQLDIVSEDSIQSALKETEVILGGKGLCCLINNAGINEECTLEDLIPACLIRNFEVNAIAPLMVTKAFLPLLEKSVGNHEGSWKTNVINIASIRGSLTDCTGKGGEYRSYGYRISKTALSMVTRCLALDLQPLGIICISLHPGWVKTDMGGPQAILSLEESVSGMLSVIAGLSEKYNGTFLDWRGETVPW
ncbi:C-factor-like [Protopterus annectens]|uniref:C-factor-like n=1 Tax=Protopterus annectens TaxID=7888 RepID=UPI001CFBE0DF|nr:C-factor-like [Protopterus annectens]